MAIDATVTDIVQEINDARVDMQSFASFMFEPANVMITRRLAPDTHSLQHYLDYLDAIKLVFTQESGDVTVGDRTIKTVQQAIDDAVAIITKSGGHVGYETLADAQADSANITAKTIVEITNDTDANNGIYLYNGTAFIKSLNDLLAQAKNYTDTAISGALKKSSGTFGTLAQLESSDLVDNSYALVANDTDEKNGHYQKKNGTWVRTAFDPLAYADSAKSKILNTAGRYTDKNIAEFADTFLERSKNLLSLSGLDVNKTVNPSTGVIESNNSYSVHPFIRVSPSAQYTISSNNIYSVRLLALYDANKVFVSRMSTTLGADNVLTVTMPENVYYIRPVVTNSSYNANEQPMLVEGATKLPYAPNQLPKLTNVRIDNSLFPLDDVNSNTEIIIDKNISEFAETFLKSTTNLLRFDGLIKGKTINASTGALLDTSSYNVHPFIKVEPSADYMLSGEKIYAVRWMAYYNSDKEILGRIDVALNSDTNTRLITTTADTHYVRFVVDNTQYNPTNKPMFAWGSEVQPYVLGRDLLYNVGLSDEIKQNIKDLFVDNRYRFDLPVTNVFNAPSGYTQYDDIQKRVPVSYIYDKWDALALAHPDYITKQYLGLSTGDHEVSCYKLTAPRYRGAVNDKYPTIFLTCGLHGQEPVSVFTSFALADQLCNNWESDEALELLRFNADIIIIPIINPSGWAATERKSASGVDIGRNFPCSSWEQYANVDPTQNTYAGPYPASEPETQYVMQVFEENEVDIYYDFHNFSASEQGTTNMAWLLNNSQLNARMSKVARVFFGRMSRKWYKDYTWIPMGWESGFSQVVTGGLPYNYAAEIMKTPLCGTLEFSTKIPLQDPAGTMFDETHSKMLVEGIVNWFLVNLHELTILQETR